MKDIPLIKVRYAVSFAEELSRIGAPTEKLLDQIGLSEEILSSPESFIPVDQMWRLTALSAHHTGIWDFGLNAGLTPLEQHSEFGHQLMFAPTLYQSIQTFCELANTELSNANFHIRDDKDIVWFCGGAEKGTAEEIQQVELYRLGMMLQMIHAAAGSDWQLKELELQSCNALSLRDTELIRNANVKFGCSTLAVGISSVLMSKPMLPPVNQIKEKNGGDLSLTTQRRSVPKQTFESALKEIVRTYVKVNRTKTIDIANALNVPLRTFQRHLNKQGLSFTQLLDQVRMETAVKMLKDTDAKIVDVALESGYSEAPHFARAFKRITGLTPIQYRNYQRQYHA